VFVPYWLVLWRQQLFLERAGAQMVNRDAVEFPQKQEVRVFHTTNSRDLADTRCSSSASVDETVVARARNFVPELRCRSKEIRAIGRIPHDLFDRLLAEGLLSTPRNYCGLQANVKTRKAAIAELGRGDLSVGWVAALMNNAAWALYALFPKDITDRLSATPAASAGASLHPSSRPRCAKRPEAM
jgi:3-hydroxy-9,10-secoandrosta-1,3,5(10)-triene-9,17-dione monooxygenase